MGFPRVPWGRSSGRPGWVDAIARPLRVCPAPRFRTLLLLLLWQSLFLLLWLLLLLLLFLLLWLLLLLLLLLLLFLFLSVMLLPRGR